LKLYPLDIVDGEIRPWLMSDPERLFPILDRAQERGIRNIAIHKALPIGPLPMASFKPGDVEEAAAAFPELTIEIVHGGLAFLEETAWQVARHPNIVINLEATNYAILKAPLAFAQVIGTLLNFGAENRMVWATGAMAVHPRPLIEAFWAFEMPEMLVQGYGFPPLTDETKRKILGENAARMLGVDLDAARDRAAADTRELAPPWSAAKPVAS
jgi:predicted TIM-barrel fold metal-dependent hydrolase